MRRYPSNLGTHSLSILYPFSIHFSSFEGSRRYLANYASTIGGIIRRFRVFKRQGSNIWRMNPITHVYFGIIRTNTLHSMKEQDSSASSRVFRILIINPNTSTQMTETLKPIVQRLDYDDVEFDYFNAPNKSVTLPDRRLVEPVPSINSGEDSVQSCTALSSICGTFDPPI